LTRPPVGGRSRSNVVLHCRSPRVGRVARAWRDNNGDGSRSTRLRVLCNTSGRRRAPRARQLSQTCPPRHSWEHSREAGHTRGFRAPSVRAQLGESNGAGSRRRARSCTFSIPWLLSPRIDVQRSVKRRSAARGPSAIREP
jgi:hypothetical protein